MTNLPPFHSGELQVQQRLDVSDIAQRNGKVINNKIPLGAINFVAEQQMLAVTSVDESGEVWVSILLGSKGFVTAPDAQSLSIDITKVVSAQSDPFWHNIKTNPQVGVVALELSTRRRLRVNGQINAVDDSCFKVTVEQAYPNCPKYIQRRDLRFNESPEQLQAARFELPQPETGSMLTDEQMNLITLADSLFVGSSTGPQQQGQTCDASYRGGEPGFVEVFDQKVIRIPDYQGNNMFNTLGNIQLNPKASLVFIDFDQGRLLQVSGRAEILWSLDDNSNKTGGTKRFWQLTVERWQQTELPKALDWQFYDYSPHNPRQTKPRQTKPEVVDELALKVQQIVQKSKYIRQYRLTASDGAILPAFEPGAHLPVEVTLPNGEKAERHYSLLSSSHDNRFYDIAVQTEPDSKGGSAYMHQHLQVESRLKAKPPRNEFPLAPVGEHTILIAGGIGITPILSMLRHLVENKSSFEIHYTAKTQPDLAFAREVKSLAADKAHLYFSTGLGAQRLDLQVVMKTPQANTHIFVCGPVRMIEAVRELGDSNGWPEGQIHFESFGPVSSVNDKAIEITLKKSEQIVQVQPAQTILDALLDAKVSVPFDCKRGDCGMCVTKVIEGEAEHRDVYLNNEERKQSMCVCVSRAKGQALTLDL